MSVYFLPRAVSDADLVLMRRTDASHLEHPFAGARMLVGCCGVRDLSSGAST
ncbi:MAG: hypothetical protein RXR52_31170 [Paraburkholderia sp.]